MDYRKDIDGMRAIAVVSVILFHSGLMPFGYLGVDIFFTISGFLITGIIFKQSIEGKFSITDFYLRRIRRILPLVLFSTLVVFFIGYFVMLPNDLENLCHSIVATDLFSNNFLEKITAKNYWATSNNYDPLMHTWSLGIEEQFYLIFPLLFFINQKKRNFTIKILIILTIISMLLFITSKNSTASFYFIQYRFFELSIGGIAAILFYDRTTTATFKPFSLLLVLLLLTLPATFIDEKLRLILVIICSSLLLLPSFSKNSFIENVLSNPVATAIGKISFSLYIWHQIVFAFARYHFFETIDLKKKILLIFLTFLFSIVSYYLIESPFRNKKIISNKLLIKSVLVLFLTSISLSIYIMSIGGIVRDIPELDFTKKDRQKNHILGYHVTEKHIDYNKRIHKLDKPFQNNGKIKILVIGNSYARDWCNILLESKKSPELDISYIEQKDKNPPKLDNRIHEADFIFFSCAYKNDVLSLSNKLNIDTNKIWNVGTKNFGINNGLIYANKDKNDYFKQTVVVKKATLILNKSLKDQWGEKYIDLISFILIDKDRVPVFTNENKFYSQDCLHLTEAGARQFSLLIPIDEIIRK